MELTKDQTMIVIEGLREHINTLHETYKEECLSHYFCIQDNYKKCKDKNPEADHKERVDYLVKKAETASTLVEDLAKSFLEFSS